MKKYSRKSKPDTQIYIGETEEIKVTYKSIARNRNPLFCFSKENSSIAAETIIFIYEEQFSCSFFLQQSCCSVVVIILVFFEIIASSASTLLFYSQTRNFVVYLFGNAKSEFGFTFSANSINTTVLTLKFVLFY